MKDSQRLWKSAKYWRCHAKIIRFAHNKNIEV